MRNRSPTLREAEQFISIIWTWLRKVEAWHTVFASLQWCGVAWEQRADWFPLWNRTRRDMLGSHRTHCSCCTTAADSVGLNTLLTLSVIWKWNSVSWALSMLCAFRWVESHWKLMALPPSCHHRDTQRSVMDFPLISSCCWHFTSLTAGDDMLKVFTERVQDGKTEWNNDEEENVKGQTDEARWVHQGTFSPLRYTESTASRLFWDTS